MTDRRLDSTVVTATAAGRGEWVAIGFVVVAFGLAMGVPGAVAGLATAAVWQRLGTPYAIAAGHVLLVALGPGTIDPLSFVIFEAAMVGLLIAPTLQGGRPGRLLASTLLAVAVFGAIAWFVSGSQPLWVAGALTLGTIAFASYAGYRYTLVVFDLLDEQTPSTGTDV